MNNCHYIVIARALTNTYHINVKINSIHSSYPVWLYFTVGQTAIALQLCFPCYGHTGSAHWVQFLDIHTSNCFFRLSVITLPLCYISSLLEKTSLLLNHSLPLHVRIPDPPPIPPPPPKRLMDAN